jgi:hypothetical protein
MRRAALWLFAAACAPDVVYVEDGPRVTSVSPGCWEDGQGDDVLDIEATSANRPSGVFCSVEERGEERATVELDRERANLWFGSYWADDLNVNCDRPQGITVTCWPE